VTYPAVGGPNTTETYSYNALSEVTGYTDRNATAHTYLYDVLGRQTSDQVMTLGSGVDGAVRRLDTAYDTGDRPYLFTSYADTGGSTVVNQVQWPRPARNRVPVPCGCGQHLDDAEGAIRLQLRLHQRRAQSQQAGKHDLSQRPRAEL
jgi:YD repeat-containing protein